MAQPLPTDALILQAIEAGTAPGVTRAQLVWNPNTLQYDRMVQPLLNAGTVNVLGALTDAQLRASAVPMSAASLPLPAGAATSARQDTEIASLANLDVALSTRLKPADTLAGVTNLAQLGGQAIAMASGVRTAGTQRVTIATDDLVPISAASLPLPTSAATEATLAAARDRLPTTFAPSGALRVDGSLPVTLTDTFTYVSGGIADGKIATSVRAIGGTTVTDTFTYDVLGKLTSIGRVVT